jgi:hypothetical protein
MNLLNNKFIYSAILVVILLFLAVEGVLWYKNKKQVDMQASELSSAELTADWKTYTNEDYGFEFKYPESLAVDEVKGSSDFEKRYTDARIDTPSNIQINKNVDGTEGLPIFLDISGHEPVNKPEGDCERGFVSSKIILGGISATKCVGESMYGPGSMIISYSKDGVIYYYIASDRYINNDQDLIDQILSTFKFTNPMQTNNFSIPPAGYNWKLVTNDKDKFFTSGQVFYDEKKDGGKYGLINFKGKEWIFKTTEEAQNFPFAGLDISEADKMLKENNWFPQIQYKNFQIDGMAADGPNGSDWGLVKLDGNKLSTVIFADHTTFNGPVEEKNGEEPEENCPCEYEYRVFLGDPVDIDSVLPK